MWQKTLWPHLQCLPVAKKRIYSLCSVSCRSVKSEIPFILVASCYQVLYKEKINKTLVRVKLGAMITNI